MKTLWSIIILCTCSILSYAQDYLIKIDQAVELGQVHWNRDYNMALIKSSEKKLPVFMFFQEVPGCNTCSTFGNQVMSHPLIVEAIESYFIPLVIYNNKGGSDAEVLKIYGEPTWNNPVIRIVNSEGKDIVKRHAGAYDPAEVINTILNGILASNQIAPNYLNLLRQELSSTQKEAILSMYCFWEGEKQIGSMNGVISTQAGYMNGTEVVKIKYNPIQISYQKLISDSAKKRCADKVYTNENSEVSAAKKYKIKSDRINKYKVDSQDKYYLSQTKYKSIPMLAIQATKCNALLAKKQLPDELLSPRQLSILELVSKEKIAAKNRAKGNYLQEWSALIK